MVLFGRESHGSLPPEKRPGMTIVAVRRFSELFGISESDLDPAGAYFCRFGNFCFSRFFF